MKLNIKISSQLTFSFQKKKKKSEGKVLEIIFHLTFVWGFSMKDYSKENWWINFFNTEVRHLFVPSQRNKVTVQTEFVLTFQY